MNLNKKRELIISGNMYKAIISLALPIMINNFIQTLYNLVDGVFISSLGSVEFAATSFVSTINHLLVTIGLGFSVAGISILSQLIGSKEYEKANKYASQLLVFSTLIGVVLAFIGFFTTEHLLKFMQIEEDLIYFGNLYLRITILDLPFMFMFAFFNAIMSSQGNTVLPTVLSGISAITNIILDPILMFTFDMGVAGAAWATVISKMLLGVGGMIILLNSDKSMIKPDFKNFRFNKDIIINSMKVAIPSTVGQSGAAFGFLALNFFVVSYSTATMAAYSLVNRVVSLVVQPSMGIGTSIVAIVGQNLGASNISRARECFKKACVLTSLVGIFGFFIILFFRVPIVNFFMQSKDDLAVIDQGIDYLLIISVSLPMLGIFSAFQGLFQGSGKTKYSMFMEIARLWFTRIPMILLFKYFTDFEEIGIWISMSLSNWFVCIYGYYVYRKELWVNRLVN